MNRTAAPRGGSGLERADIFAALMFHDTGGAIGISEFQGHDQARRTERFTRRRELPLVGFVVALLRKGHGGEAEGGVVFAVKIGGNTLPHSGLR